MAPQDVASALTIQLFGPLAVWRQGQPITKWKQEKTKTLLKIFASVPGHIFRRDQLIEWLWPDSDPQRSQETLKNRIAELRRILEPDLKKGEESQFILTQREGYCFNPEADCFIDLREFYRQYKRGRAAEQAGQYEGAEIAYEEALRLCEAGDLLAEDLYEDWAGELRRAWEKDHLELLSHLADCHARLGHYRRAIARCRQVLQKEPNRESMVRQLMLYSYASGSLNEALRAYEEALTVIGKPARETQALYQQIRAGHVPEVDGATKLYPSPRVLPHRIPYLLSPGSVPFAGRQKEYAQLVSHLEQARRRHGRFVLICGEAGVGKTRLAQELLAYARKRLNVRVFHGRGDELTPQLSYRPWAEAIRHQLDSLKREDLHCVAPLWLAEVATLVPELRTKFPDLPCNPALPPQQAQLRFFEGLVQFFLGIAEPKRAPKPLVIFLDDLGWVDPASLDVLSYFIPRLERQPILILGTYRGEEAGGGHAVLTLTRTWESKGLGHCLSLGRLTDQESLALLTSLPLKLKRPEVFYHRLYRETAGNPFFLVSTLQHFFEEGALRVEGQSWITDIEDISTNYRELMIPPTVKELIQRRVGRLGQPEQMLLKLASAIGNDFEFALLERAWEGDSHECLTALERVTEAQLLVEHQGRYEFTHDKIREVVYEEISLPRRQFLHSRVLQVLEQLYSGQLEERAGLLAHHASRAGAWKKALAYSVQALKKSVKELHPHEGLKLAELGWEAAQQLEAKQEDQHYVDEQKFEILNQRVNIFTVRGQRHEQQHDLHRMEELANRLQDKGKQALTLHKRHELYFWIGKRYEAEKDARQALALYEEIGDKPGQGACWNGLGNIYHSLGKYEEALGFYHQGLQILKETGDKHGQGACLIGIGIVYRSLGRYDEALECYHQSLQILKEIDDKRGQGACWNGIGSVYESLENYEEALRCYRQGLQILEEIGDKRGQGISLNGMGNAYHSLGSYEEALEYYHQSLQILQEIGDKPGQGVYLNSIGNLYRNLGRYEEALGCYHQGLQILQEIGNKRGQGACLGNIGTVYRERGQQREALRYYGQARALFEEIGARAQLLECLSLEGIAHLELNEKDRALAYSLQALQMLEQTNAPSLEIYWHHFKILSAHGQDETAYPYLKKAYDTVMQRANKIKDPQTRKRFLTNVKTNRAIVKEYQKTAMPPKSSA